MDKKKMITLRLPVTLHEVLKEMAREKRRTVTDIILESLDKSVSDFKEILEFEKKGIFVPCEHCEQEISFYDLKKQGRVV